MNKKVKRFLVGWALFILALLIITSILLAEHAPVGAEISTWL